MMKTVKDKPPAASVGVVIASPVGPLELEADGGAITRIGFHAKGRAGTPPAGVLAEAAMQLDEYFAGRRTEFALPLAPSGTPFQREVWTELIRVRYAETSTYAEIARRIGRPAAVRAVGAANGRNPIPIVIPCHRIIGSDGRLVGFGGGLEMKQFLLRLEQRKLF
jgi:methylated-DNA-[protein]-cysteine S-methyltransferase